MTTHPGDNIDNRFRAFWAGIVGLVAFGVVLVVALKFFGGGNGGAASSEPPLTKVDQNIIAVRGANLEAVSAAQQSLVPEEKVMAAKSSVIAALSAKKPAKTELVVPNSPTFIKQVTQGTPEPEAPAADETAAAKPQGDAGAETEAKPAEKAPEN